MKLQKWFLHQNGVELNQKSKSDDSGPLYKVTERCEAVPELSKVLLKMASGLISPSGHGRLLCIGAQLPLSCLQLGLLMTSRNIEYFSDIQHLKNILSLKFRVMLLNSKNICQYVIFQSGQDTVVPFTPIRWSYFQNLSLPFYCEWEANCLNVQNERN